MLGTLIFPVLFEYGLLRRTCVSFLCTFHTKDGLLLTFMLLFPLWRTACAPLSVSLIPSLSLVTSIWIFVADLVIASLPCTHVYTTLVWCNFLLIQCPPGARVALITLFAIPWCLIDAWPSLATRLVRGPGLKCEMISNKPWELTMVSCCTSCCFVVWGALPDGVVPPVTLLSSIGRAKCISPMASFYSRKCMPLWIRPCVALCPTHISS